MKKPFYLWFAGLCAALQCFVCTAADQTGAKSVLVGGERAEKAPATNQIAAPQGLQRVSVAEFDALRLSTKAPILDVRTASEFAAGHLPGAINIDINEPDFEEKVKKLDPSKTYLIHCAAGSRSARACSKLVKWNFKSLIELGPGFNGWQAAGKPVEK